MINVQGSFAFLIIQFFIRFLLHHETDRHIIFVCHDLFHDQIGTMNPHKRHMGGNHATMEYWK